MEENGATQIRLRDDRIEFKIEITKIVRHDYIGTERKIAEKRHYTDEERDENHRYMRESENPDKYIKEVYKDVCSLEVSETKVQLLSQTVEQLDLAQVIKAINGL